MIKEKVISLGVKFNNKPFIAKEPPTSAGMIYINKFEEEPRQTIKSLRLKKRSHEIFRNGFNHKK
jgi:ribosomal protein L30/L7E